MEVKKIPEPALEFYENPSYPVDDARYGLERFKPFDKDTRGFSEVNVVALGPSKLEEPFREFWQKLANGLEKKDKYDVPYKLGFQDLLQVDRITQDDEMDFYKIEEYNGDLNQQYELALQDCIEKKEKEAIILVLQPQNDREFNLRNELKLKLLRDKVKSQFVRPQTILKTEFLGGVLNNFAVGLYAKYGGTPWRLKDPKFTNTMILGISFHPIRASRFDAPERTIFGFSEVVDEFGYHVGMTVNPVTFKKAEFDELYKHRSLFMPSELIQSLITKSIEKFKNKTKDIVPKNIIIHKTSPYHEEEIQGLKESMKAAGFTGEYALVHLQNDTGYKTYRTEDHKSMRGLFLRPNQKQQYGVLWTVGVIPAQYRDRITREMRYYERGGVRIGTATPWGISIHRESQLKDIDLDFIAEQVLALTKMRWNNLEPSVREPISTYFARGGGKFLAKIWNEHNKEIDILMENLDARFLL